MKNQRAQLTFQNFFLIAQFSSKRKNTFFALTFACKKRRPQIIMKTAKVVREHAHSTLFQTGLRFVDTYHLEHSHCKTTTLTCRNHLKIPSRSQELKHRLSLKRNFHYHHKSNIEHRFRTEKF